MTSDPILPVETDLKLIVRKANEVLATRAAEKFAAAVQPIYGATARGEPDHIGSAVLLDVHGTKVLITAAHVIDNNSDTSLYVGAGTNLELIEAEFGITGAAKTMRKLDRYDIAFCELPPALIEKLGGTYIGMADIARYVPYEDGRLYTALGYPNSMNKVGRQIRKAGKIRPEMLQYSNVYRRDEEVPRDLPDGGAGHIFLPYGKRSRDRDGIIDNSKSPFGMSGGAVIDCGMASNPETAAGLNEPTQRLAGIAIEFQKDRVMIATRMSIVIPTLVEAFTPKG